MTATELEVLNHYNRKMLKYDESPDIILKCLWKLDRVQVNIALLQVGSYNVIDYLKFPIFICLEYRYRENCKCLKKEIWRI